MREEMGLNENAFIRYFKWLSKVFKGDFGTSSQYNTPVRTLIEGRISITLWLTLLSVIMIIILSIPLGLIATKKVNGWLDRILTLVSHIAMAIPPFFLGILITLL